MNRNTRSFRILAMVVFIFATRWVFAAAKEQIPPPKPPLVLTIDETTPFPSSPGFHTVKAKVKDGTNEFPVAFGLHIPSHYFASKDPYGLVISMHNVVDAMGGSEGGEGLIGEGPGAMMAQKDWVDQRRSGTLPEKPVDIKKFPLITLLPQTPKDKDFDRWPMNGVIIKTVDELVKRMRIDVDRVYLTGFSHGGTCVWRVAEEFPDRFAAVVPMSGRMTGNPAQTAEKLKNVAIWMGYGDSDADWAINDGKTMNDAMTKVKLPDYQCTVVKGGNHFCYYNIMKDQKFWDWMLSKKRPGAKPVKPPPPPVVVITKVTPEIAAPWDAKLLAKLKDAVAKSAPFSYKSPTYKDTAKIKSIDAQGVMSESIGPIEMKTTLNKVSFVERCALSSALMSDSDGESIILTAFYSLAAGDKTAGEALIKKAGPKGEDLKAMFFPPPPPLASPAP